MVVGYFVLLIATHDSVVGNILFPTGVMASQTLSAWLSQQMGIIYSSVKPIRTVVPPFYLFFPVLSGILQIGLVWFVVRRIFEKEITKA